MPLTEISGMYLRLMDDRLLPGVAKAPPDSPERARTRRFHELLLRFADIAPGRVLNRPADTASNHSKPYQAQLIRETVIRHPGIAHHQGSGRRARVRRARLVVGRRRYLQVGQWRALDRAPR